MAKKPKLKDEVTSISDDYGNLLVVKNNGKRIIVTLRLVAEGNRFRKVGVINLATKIMEVQRNREKHLFRKGNAYGFNHKLLSDAKLFDKIRLKDDKEEWKIPVSFILQNGKFLHFQSNGGFEKQIFISLPEIEEFKRIKAKI
jgi:hypothetical protein